VDRVLEADEAHVVSEHTVREGPLAARGALWEGALVEGLAQTAAVFDALARAARGAPPPRRGLLVGVRGFQVLARPAVGERVRYEVRLVRRMEPLVLVDGRALRAGSGELLAEGRFKFYVEEA